MSKWEAMAHSEVLFKHKLLKGFPGGSSGKKSPCLQETQETRVRSLRSGRSPGEEHVDPLQYFCLENPRHRGTSQATVHGSQRVGHD